MQSYCVEMMLIGTAFFALAGCVFATSEKARRTVGVVIAWLLVFSAFFAFQKNVTGIVSFLIVSSAAVAYIFALNWMQYKKFPPCEYAFFYVMSLLGQLTALRAHHFVSLFLGMELAQTALMFLVAYKRYGLRSTRAATRFFTVSFLSSGLMLTGMAVLYVLTGSFDFAETVAYFEIHAPDAIAVAGVSLCVAGVLIKTGAVPFHVWFADVYEGSPSPVTAFMGMVWRPTLVIILATLVREPFGVFGFYWHPVLSVLAVLTVVTASFAAGIQTNIKRLAALTVMCGNGLAFVPMLTGNTQGLLFLLTIEAVLFAGLFAIVLSLRVEDDLCEEIAVLTGKGKNNLLRGAFFSLIFIGLTGLPPFAGFWGYWFVLKEAVSEGFFVVSVATMGGTVFLAYAYLKMVRLMYTETSLPDDFLPVASPMRRTIIVAAAVSFALIGVVSPLWTFLQQVTKG